MQVIQLKPIEDQSRPEQDGLAAAPARPRPTEAHSAEAQGLALFGLPMLNTSFDAVLNIMFFRARAGAKTRIAFMNAHCFNVFARDETYRAAIKSASLVLPDGSGVALAARMAGQVCEHNLNGTDLFPLLCERAQAEGRSVYFLGGKPGVAQGVAERCAEKWPNLKIAGYRDGYFTEADNGAVIETINQSGADILMVARGVPLQDTWLAEHSAQLKPAITLGVGGLFDFMSGRIPRAPEALRKRGLEWTYRLYQEPKRLARRYLVGNAAFIARSLRFALGQRIKSASAGIDAALRRTIDFAGAAAGLVFIAPLLAMTALAIRLDSRGPALFKQTRIGLDGAPFTMYKFRSMRTNAEAERIRLEAANKHGASAVTFKIDNDPRITRVGAFIRKFSIDELPQLWNVLTGDMSLVGPRPALPSEVARYTPEQRARLSARPGITCYWQIMGRGDIPFEEQVKLDTLYITRQSAWTNVKILLQTPYAVLSGRGAY